MLTRSVVFVFVAAAWSTWAVRSEESPVSSADNPGNQGKSVSTRAKENPVCPALTRIRFLPRKGFAQRMLKGRFTSL